MTYRERQMARKAAPKPNFKILKGKKDITEHPGEAKPQSRRARFYDPESNFGKKSLVYQVKSGQLREELGKLQSQPSSDPIGDAFSRQIRGFGDSEQETRGSRGRSRRDAPREDRGPRRQVGSRDFGGPRERRERSAPARGRQGFREEFREERDSRERPRSLSEPRAPRRAFEPTTARQPETSSRTEARDGAGTLNAAPRSGYQPSAAARPRQEAREHHPLSVPYTTAASQFLYGKSVVEAALRGGRRKLYKLYIYHGRNPSGREAGLYKEGRSAQDVAIERLAAEKRVEIVKLGDDGLRLMDKMSGGRPHNNCVLEASPLPQLPVVALGSLSESSDKPGFDVTLAHQSTEEIAITGSSNFISTQAGSTHKPFVVVLHGVLDPGNVGAILRSAGYLGATAVATTKRGSAPLTPVALKAAAGASESLTLFTIDSIERFLEESRENGWAVYAAVPPPANGRHPREHIDMRGIEDTDPLREKPCVLLLGSEGEGLAKTVLKRTDCDVNIPSELGTDMVDSLNVSVAAGLLCHAFLRGKIGETAAKEREQERKLSLF